MAKSASKRSVEADHRHGRELAGGYIASGLIFAGVTALWSVIVRDDPYYGMHDVFGVRAPATMIAYLALMPIAGFLIGRWRYDHGAGHPASFAAKLGARFLHFTYAHSLIVLFTALMLAETWLGLDLEAQARQVDDRLFDLAARFAPWLAAYLAGYNFGRATRPASPPARSRAADAPAFIAPPSLAESAEIEHAPAISAGRGEPVFAEPAALPAPAPPRQSASGLPLPAENQPSPGFLPPQDLDRLRPALNRLR